MRRLICFVTALLFVPSVCGLAQQTHWVATWSSAQQIPEPNNTLSSADLTDATLRQVVHLSLGGSRLRIRLSNAFGVQPLHVVSAHIAKPGAGGAIDPAQDAALTFSGLQSVTIPAGADYLSDSIDFPVSSESDLAVTMYFDRAPERQTSHPGSRASSYLAHGNLVSAAALPKAKRVEHWYFLSTVEIEAGKDATALIAFGDSITDGHGATTDGNDRWPDNLGRMLIAKKATHELAVINEGIGGNHMLTDGLGPNALARFDRDVLAPSGASTVLLLEGVNDLGAIARSEKAVSAEERAAHLRAVEASFEQFVARARAHGLKVIGGTILPYAGSDYYHPAPIDEADRIALNAWIRAAGHFDAVVDFDHYMRDPQHTDRLLPAYDSGDHLHPSPEGYRMMAATAALVLLKHQGKE